MIDNGPPVRAVESRALYNVVLGVHPVDLAISIVDGQTVRPEQRRVGQRQAVPAVHRRPLDLGRLTPVCPEDGSGRKDNFTEY